MAWNRSQGQSGTAETPRTTSSHVRGLAAGILIVVGAVGAFVWLRPIEENRQGKKESSTTALIREVSPHISTNAVAIAKESATRESVPKELPPQQLGEVRDGYVLLGSGLHKIRGEVTNNCSMTRGKYEIFKHSAENIIAALLSMKAGDSLVGEPNYDGAFVESLKKSLKDPIRLEKTDTPEQVELKQAVIEAKEELKKALDRGEDVEQIIIDSRRECQSLARCKQMMMADVYEFVDKKAVSKDDVETYVEAANKLLEAKGVAPIEHSTLVDIKLRHKLDDYEHNSEEEETGK